MVQSDQTAPTNKDTRPKRKPRSVSRQDRHLKWRRNYMVTSMPSHADDMIQPQSLKRADFHSFTQSLHRQTNKELKREMRKQRLLKLLRDCAESMESIACKSYVESMRSCPSTDSSLYVSNVDSSQDLIVLEDNPGGSSTGSDVGANRRHQPTDSKHLSEIVLREHSEPFSQMGSGEVLYLSSDNLPKQRSSPKLRLANSFCSSYVEDSDLSCSPSEDDLSTKLGGNKWLRSTPVYTRTDRYGRLNEDDYRELVSNGKSTAFLSQNDEEISLYYDDEFDTENSPLGAPLHDSGLEAAICHQYASLLRTAAAGGLNNHSLSSNVTHSNFSSDFENIFPASLSSLHVDASIDERGRIEEITELERSVPNYADMPAPTKQDYQLTFTQTG